MPKMFSNPEAIAEDIIRDVGTNLVVGLPLGLGKANHIANALYARAAADRSINLTFFTALTLEKPRPKNLLQWRFIAPVIDRLFGGYPDLAYADALRANALPPNIKVIEFFFLAGRWLHVPFAQQHYISANYTHACVLSAGARAQRRHATGGQARRRRRRPLQPELQHRHHAGYAARARRRRAPRSNWSGRSIPNCRSCRARAICRGRSSARCSTAPRPIFRCSRRRPSRSPIPDTPSAFTPQAWCATAARLQIGIGQVGDALAQGLIVRHRDNAQYHGIMKRLVPGPEQLAALHTGSFEQGLYGVSEMLFEAFLGLIDAGILKREVDGVVLHGAFFLGPKSFYRACAR